MAHGHMRELSPGSRRLPGEPSPWLTALQVGLCGGAYGMSRDLATCGSPYGFRSQQNNNVQLTTRYQPLLALSKGIPMHNYELYLTKIVGKDLDS